MNFFPENERDTRKEVYARVPQPGAKANTDLITFLSRHFKGYRNSLLFWSQLRIYDGECHFIYLSQNKIFLLSGRSMSLTKLNGHTLITSWLFSLILTNTCAYMCQAHMVPTCEGNGRLWNTIWCILIHGSIIRALFLNVWIMFFVFPFKQQKSIIHQSALISGTLTVKLKTPSTLCSHVASSSIFLALPFQSHTLLELETAHGYISKGGIEWRDGSVIKSTGCPFRGPNSVPRTHLAVHKKYTYIHMDKILIHIQIFVFLKKNISINQSINFHSLSPPQK